MADQIQQGLRTIPPKSAAPAADDKSSVNADTQPSRDHSPYTFQSAFDTGTPQPSIVLQYKQILSDIGIPKESSAPGKNRIQTAIRRLQSTGLFTTQKLMATDISKARKALRLTIHHLGLEDGLPHRGL